jgi:hypothetical protein
MDHGGQRTPNEIHSKTTKHRTGKRGTMSRFTDDLNLIAPTDYIPTSAQALLLHLHLEDAPRTQQETAIRTWLQEHTPGKLMTLTLKRKGFGHLLTAPVTP